MSRLKSVVSAVQFCPSAPFFLGYCNEIATAVHGVRLVPETPAQRRRRIERAKQEAARLAKKAVTNAPPRWWHRTWAKVVLIGGLIGAGFGLVAGFIALANDSLVWFPRMTIVQGALLNPDDPFSSTFTITNTNPFSIYNVTPSCDIHHVKFGEADIANNGSAVSTDTQPRMRPDDATTTLCRLGMEFPRPSDKVTWADVEILVSFSTPWHTKHRRAVRFVTTVHDSAGRLQWTPRPAKNLAPDAVRPRPF